MAPKAHFASLPGELLNHIYEEYTDGITLQVRNGVAVPPALARVCRKFREELMSILHTRLFHTAPLEARAVNWDFTPVIEFIKKLKAHSNGSTRALKIFIDVYNPAYNYSEERLRWCVEARFALAWYREQPQREADLINSRNMPVRLRIDDQFFDVTHVVRFPPSHFSLQSRLAGVWPYMRFEHAFRHGSRPAALNYQLERSLMAASKVHVFVRDYWERYAAWNEKLRLIREEARYQQKMELSRRLGLPSMLQLYPGGSVQDRLFSIKR